MRRTIKASELVFLEKYENESPKTTLSMKDCVTTFSETSVGNSVVVVSNIHSIWDKIVGTDTSQHAKVRHVRNGVLYISVDHPAWSTQLKYMQSRIISEISKALPDEEITSIHMSVKRS